MSEVLWYYEDAGKQAGPISHAAIAEAIRSGRLPAGSRVWRAGMAGWQPWEAVAELAALAPPPVQPPPLHAPPVPPPQAPPPAVVYYPVPASSMQAQVPGSYAPRQRLSYVLLGLFLGFFGVHNFYAGYVVRALAQLFITLFLGWFIFPLGFMLLWVILEVALVTRDSRGVPFT